jgi:hypothetical protein
MQGGWGAQHRPDIGDFLFGLSGSGVFALMIIGVEIAPQGSKFF